MTAKTYTTKNLLPSKLKSKKKRRRRIILTLILCLAVVILALWFFLFGRNAAKKLSTADGPLSEYDLVVTMIDVGQGSAAVISADGESMLIDTGTREESKNVAAYLRENNIEELDYAVASHAHADHMGGMSDIILEFEVDVLMLPEADSDTESYKYMQKAARKRECEIVHPAAGTTYELGGGSFTVLWDGSDYGEDFNDSSLVICFTYEDESFLFMGDASENVETKLLHGKMKKYLKAEVLIAGHHGSSDASSADFIKYVRPAEAVISCGKDNDYGHPHRETLDILKKYGAAIRRTDLLGNITYVAKREGELGIYEVQ